MSVFCSYFDDSDEDESPEEGEAAEPLEPPQQADPAAAVRKNTILLTAACRANMCVCCMKQQKWSQAVEHATNAMTYVEKGSTTQVD